MPSLSDAELLRIAGLRAEQAIRVLPALRQALVLLPNDPIHANDSPQWPLFATAVAYTLQRTMPPPFKDGWVDRWQVLSVIAQVVGILKNRGEHQSELEWAINRAANRHWMNATGDASEFEAEIVRPTLLGERMVREKLGSAITNFDKVTDVASGVERLKAFRAAFHAYVQDAQESQQHNQQIDAHKFGEMQDAWIDLADVVHPKELYEVDDIEAAVTELWPDHANDVWTRAGRQIGRIILSIGSEARLQRARAEAFRSEIDKLFPDSAGEAGGHATPSAGVIPAAVAIAPSGEPADDIQYITRDAAAALCGVSKGTIERWLVEDSDSPEPVRPGGGGKRHEYDYRTLRPWLIKRSGRQLPISYDSGALR